MDPQAMAEQMREAISVALHPYVTTEDHDKACAAVIDAFKARLVDDLPAIIGQAMAAPEYLAAMTTTLVVPLLREIEDGLNDDHDKPSTKVYNRPGLRRAARTIREIRREIETNPSGEATP